MFQSVSYFFSFSLSVSQLFGSVVFYLCVVMAPKKNKVMLPQPVDPRGVPPRPRPGPSVAGAPSTSLGRGRGSLRQTSLDAHVQVLVRRAGNTTDSEPEFDEEEKKVLAAPMSVDPAGSCGATRGRSKARGRRKSCASPVPGTSGIPPRKRKGKSAGPHSPDPRRRSPRIAARVLPQAPGDDTDSSASSSGEDQEWLPTREDLPEPEDFFISGKSCITLLSCDYLFYYNRMVLFRVIHGEA